MTCVQLDLPLGVTAHGTDPCQQLPKQVALLAAHRALIRLDHDYSLRPRAGWPRSRKVFGDSPSPQTLKEPKSLYHAPSGASGSDFRQSLSSYRSSALIFLSRRRSNRWSPRAGGRSFHRLRHQSPNVRRANSSLIRSRTAGSLALVSRSASLRNRSRSASWASRPPSINSAMTRLALAFFARASALTLRATPAERVTLCRNGLAVLRLPP